MTVPDLPVYVDQSIRYTDFLSITLTALAVILAVLGVVVAVLAFVGYHQILNAGRQEARRAASEYLAGESFKNVLKEVTGAVPQPGVSVAAAAEKEIAKEYPKGKEE
jgi:ABC-type uncharacterized transport system YnjBCD permease subunit